jgi:NAD(P)-dependent dehydrogenase (short-subunit alcohol dehydrogenase family)
MPPPSDQTPVIALSGASSGLGLAAATDLVRRGYRVVGGARRFPRAELSFETLRLDVCDHDSVQAFVETTVARHGRIDALVNCAGTAFTGALEETTDAEERAMFEVNVFGTLRMCRAALPHLRRCRPARIVNVSSIAGFVGLPFQTTYCATKFAVEGLSESLQYELRPFGVSVSLLQPGDFLTEMTERNVLARGAVDESCYAEARRRVVQVMDADCRANIDLSPFTRTLARVLSQARPRLRYTVAVAGQRLGAALSRHAPDGLVAATVQRLYR